MSEPMAWCILLVAALVLGALDAIVRARKVRR
jgi:hypothetical protein